MNVVNVYITVYIHNKLFMTMRPPVQIHDELLFEVHRSALPAAAVLIQEVMEGTTRLDVPLPVKLQVGPNWGSLEVMKEVVMHPMSLPADTAPL